MRVDVFAQRHNTKQYTSGTSGMACQLPQRNYQSTSLHRPQIERSKGRWTLLDYLQSALSHVVMHSMLCFGPTASLRPAGPMSSCLHRGSGSSAGPEEGRGSVTHAAVEYTSPFSRNSMYTWGTATYTLGGPRTTRLPSARLSCRGVETVGRGLRSSSSSSSNRRVWCARIRSRRGQHVRLVCGAGLHAGVELGRSLEELQGLCHRITGQSPISGYTAPDKAHCARPPHTPPPATPSPRPQGTRANAPAEPPAPPAAGWC